MTNTAVVTQGDYFSKCQVVNCYRRPKGPPTYLDLDRVTYLFCLEHRNHFLASNYEIYLLRLS